MKESSSFSDNSSIIPTKHMINIATIFLNYKNNYNKNSSSSKLSTSDISKLAVFYLKSIIVPSNEIKMIVDLIKDKDKIDSLNDTLVSDTSTLGIYRYNSQYESEFNLVEEIYTFCKDNIHILSKKVSSKVYDKKTGRDLINKEVED